MIDNLDCYYQLLYLLFFARHISYYLLFTASMKLENEQHF